MKKLILSLLLLCSVSFLAIANDYTHSVGVSLGGFNGFTYKGFIFGVDGLALEADLGARVSNMGQPGSTYVRHPGHHEADFFIPRGDWAKASNLNYYTVEINPNILYQRTFANTNIADFSWFAGGGFSMGIMDSGKKWTTIGMIYNYTTGEYTPDEYHRLEFKFGIGAMLGMEAAFKSAPLNLSVEFRPGYGLSNLYLVKEAGWAGADGVTPDPYDSNNATNFFDWSLGLSLRYRF